MQPQPNKADAKRGRPRSEQAHAAVLESTYRLLCSEGYGRLTIESIAKDAKVGKPTIYKWWPAKAALALEAFLAHAKKAVPIPDTGAIATDLELYLGALSRRLCTTPDGDILASLFNEARQDKEFSRSFSEQFLDIRRNHLRQMLKQGQLRGEIRSNLNLDLALNLIYGPLWFWILLQKEPVHGAKVKEWVDLALTGLRLHPIELP